MKLIYAGIEGTALPYSSLLFNCTRNINCERSFFVPVNAFSDIVFFADLPAKPDTYEVNVLNPCGEDVGTATFINYVIGQKPDGSWYGVFGMPVSPDYFSTHFIFELKFTFGAFTYVYYSEQMAYPICETLTRLQGCYPNEPAGSDAEDCNGIYYGVPTTEDYLGTVNYRYFHWAFLRMASVIEQKNKLSFTVFNSKKTYKNVFSKESVLEFELVPTFFKTILIGIFNRGNIKINGVEWRLAQEQEFTILDNDSKLWKLDVALAEECKQYFGCAESECVLPPVPPEPCLLPDPLPEITFEVVEGVPTVYVSNLIGIFIQWEVYEKISGLLVDSGDTSTFPSDEDPQPIPIDGINVVTTCYLFRYRVVCDPPEPEGDPVATEFSEWSENFQFGQCAIPPTLHYYYCERYLCTNCAEPMDYVVASSPNPSLTLFKYYKAGSSPVVTLRPITESVDIPADTILGGPFNTCFLCCSAPPPIEID